MIVSILNKPYPLVESPWWRFGFWVGAALFVDLFLMFFQPFGTDTFEHSYKYLFLSGYGAIVLLVFGGLDLVLLPLFEEQKWTVAKQIGWLLVETIITVTLCFFYLVWFTQTGIDWIGYFTFVLNSSAIAFFPIIILVLFHYIQQLQKYKRLANNITAQLPEAEEEVQPQELKVLGENNKDTIEFLPNQLYCIKAASNYTEFYFYKNGKLEKELLRNSLTAVEKQLCLIEQFVRCHRSYLVNLNKVQKVSGNAQGYNLFLKDISEVIPVARSKGKQVVQQLSLLLP